MVELRKRPPPKEPPAPAPAAKRGRGAASSKKAKPAGKKENVASKAKQTAKKIKEAVVGNDTKDDNTTKTAADMQPTVEDEGVIEKGDGEMTPETAGTAPNTATVPASAPTEPAAPAAEATQTAAGKASLPPTQTPAEHAAINDKAAALGIVGSSAAGPTPATDGTAASEEKTATTDPAATAEEAAGPPATEDLENPPETGKVEPASAADNVGAEVSSQDAPLATLPLSTASVGKQLPDISTLGGSVETHAGATVSLGSLLAACTSGIIIFTYPRASTPGCTQQACLFRDNYNAFTKDTGYKVYGLSMDSVKANSTFATKQNLQYELLCDKEGGLVGAIGMKKPGNTKGTTRGVVVVEKDGVVRVWFQGGPAKTVDVVKEFLETVKK